MVQINNREVTKRIEKDAFVNGTDVPTQLGNVVSPVLVSNPDKVVNIVENHYRTTSGTTTLYTTPSDKDFYLTGFSFSAQCDNAHDGLGFDFYFYMPNGETAYFIMPKLTLTAFQDHIVVNFPVPVLLKRATLIRISATYTAGNATMAATAHGYTVEPQ